jgi:hypothetical protein
MVEIGKIIEKILRQKKMPIIEFAKKINTNRNNVYSIYHRKTIDTGLLLKISEVLEHDFFHYYLTQEALLSIANEKNNFFLFNIELKALKDQNEKMEKEIKELQSRLIDKEMIIELLDSKTIPRKK